MWRGHRRESSTNPYIVRKTLATKYYHIGVVQTSEEKGELCNLGYNYVKDTKNGGSLWRKTGGRLQRKVRGMGFEPT